MPSGRLTPNYNNQSQLYRAAQARGMASSLILMTSGSSSALMPSGLALPRCPGEECSSAQPSDTNMAPGRPEMFVWLLVTDSYCYRATDLDMALSGRALALSGIEDYSHEAVPRHPRVSMSTSLHCAHIILLPVLFHLSTAHLFILVATWGPLGVWVI
jgi:hypothetical protein